MAVNYVKKFKDHYGIEFSSDVYVVHHIDQNRENNEISNLMILPKTLHAIYHNQKEYISQIAFPTRISGNQFSNDTYIISLYTDFIKIMAECNKWYDYKMFLDGKIPNIHGIHIS